MKTTGLASDAYNQDCECLVVGVDADGELGPVASRLNESLDGWLKRAVDAGDISGARFDMALIPSPGRTGPRGILVVGVGDRQTFDRGVAFQLAAAATRKISEKGRSRVAMAVEDLARDSDHRDFVAGALMGTAGQALHQQSAKLNPPDDLILLGVSRSDLQAGIIVGESVNLTRQLVNQPANIIFPESFANAAADMASHVGIDCEVWAPQRLASERCNAILAVGRAAENSPRLLKLTYNGGKTGEPPIALVGKGVTFDSGGLSLKPSESMATMKCDMAGAATVVGVMAALAKLGVKKNVIGFCGLAENMISGNAYRLGDVIQTRSGKTVEILNTDAEGRVVLADVLNVALDSKPAAIVDLATLTGACVVALGLDVCGLFTNDAELVDRVRMAAEIAGEPVWELPMFDFFGEQIKSKVADIKNVGDGRWGGAITAAKFLEQFVDKVPWVHIDIAGPAFADSPKPFRDAGATGAMVRTLVQWIESEVS
jgi:leucyl aminopeptidase